MNDALKSMIKNINTRIEAKDPTALAAAVELTEQYPDEPLVWRALGYANVRRKDYIAAIAAETREIELVPRRPALHFTRGRYALMARDYDYAIADFSRGLALCDELNNNQYCEVLYFMRAEAYVQLGMKAKARADLAHVEDDCTLWTIQVRSKAQLLALCAK